MQYRSAFVLVVLTLFPLFLSRANAEDWPKYRRDYANSGHSAETGTLANGVTTVTSGNIHNLSLKWSKSVNGKVSGTPAVVGGVVYFGTWNGSFYALDAVTGATRWSKQVCSCRIAGSAQVMNGVVYFGTSTATVYALNTADGTKKWSRTVTTQAGADIWGSPAVFNGSVYVGVASHGDNPCVQGRLYSLNATTGAINWTFNAINQATCPSGTCVGAGIWSSAALDTAANILYISTGNPGSTCAPATANATLYPDSVLAINMSTGALLGFFKAIANDTQDDDFGSSPVLLTTGSTAQCVGSDAQRQWVSDTSKNGIMYFMQRGSQIGAGPAAVSVGVGAVTSPAFRTLCTAGVGIKNNLIITVPAGNLVDVRQAENAAVTMQWSKFVSSAQMFSAPAIVNDVVFFGSKDFKLHAYTTGGTALWSFPTGNYVNSGPSVSNGRIYFGSNDGHVRCLSINAK